MRRTLAFFILVALAALSIGCSKNDQGSTSNTNATGTTTYSNSSAPPTTTAPAYPSTTAAPSGGGPNGATVGGAAPKSSPNKPGIKPPTE